MTHIERHLTTEAEVPPHVSRSNRRYVVRHGCVVNQLLARELVLLEGRGPCTYFSVPAGSVVSDTRNRQIGRLVIVTWQ